MTEDARFADGDERPLRLMAEGPEDLEIIAALVQDSVLPAAEMIWQPKQRRFALLLNRFRWEDPLNANGRRKRPERVRSVLRFDDVLRVRSQGLDQNQKDVVLSLLTVEFVPGVDGTGQFKLVLAGDGLIALDVEALNATLEDVTRPYAAPSGKVPTHD
ncbi:hypothetical protein BVG79_01657 [Ketogulonicigenium robustum]|uniref:DUF2948 family protein n=1 Tax=Ketogulonicigenium robustum TaxID=92947 RepID=A0A1W6P0S4_9RHOB|nr:DUF2948 family protein [Ketogulonicigenium robustum]ARO15001.1 hypothetical protein BVG79_01657 [Ketogulonicigenium robustum]